MNWEEHISVDQKVLVGKPVVKGTRLSVEFLLGLFGNGWNEERVLMEFPQLTQEQLQAVFQYAAHLAGEERYFAFPEA
ncbi:MAG: DUF433 domain-containing protein [Fimbriimonadales bacterium]